MLIKSPIRSLTSISDLQAHQRLEKVTIETSTTEHKKASCVVGRSANDKNGSPLPKGPPVAIPLHLKLEESSSKGGCPMPYHNNNQMQAF